MTMQAALTDLVQKPAQVVSYVCWEGAMLLGCTAEGADLLGFSACALGPAF